MKEKTFEIDFFEFAFLVEACIPDAPIARTSFFQKVINHYYDEMSPDQREELFHWIQKNPRFDLNNELCRTFFARYNPNNQYEVIASYIENNKEVTKKVHCFRFNDRYHTKINTWVDDEYIVRVEKLNEEGGN